MTIRLQLITLLTFLAVNSVSSASPIPDFPFIVADGQATREVPPTNATIHFTVLAFSKSSEEAANTVQTALGKVVTALKTEGVGEKMIRSHDLDKSALRNRDKDTDGEADILGYQVSRRVELRLPDLANYPKIVRALMIADHVSSVGSTFDINKREEVEAELTTEACTKSRKKADLLAKAAGVNIERVYAVSNSGLDDMARHFGFGYISSSDYYLSGERGAEIPLFVPSTIELSASVKILYKLAQ